MLKSMKVVYDPINGKCCPDGQVEQVVKDLIAHHKAAEECGMEWTSIIGSELIIHGIRGAVVDGLIDHEGLEVRVGEEILRFTSTAAPAVKWPLAMSYHFDFIMKIAKARRKPK